MLGDMCRRADAVAGDMLAIEDRGRNHPTCSAAEAYASANTRGAFYGHRATAQSATFAHQHAPGYGLDTDCNSGYAKSDASADRHSLVECSNNPAVAHVEPTHAGTHLNT